MSLHWLPPHSGSLQICGCRCPTTTKEQSRGYWGNFLQGLHYFRHQGCHGLCSYLVATLLKAQLWSWTSPGGVFDTYSSIVTGFSHNIRLSPANSTVQISASYTNLIHLTSVQGYVMRKMSAKLNKTLLLSPPMQM